MKSVKKQKSLGDDISTVVGGFKWIIRNIYRSWLNTIKKCIVNVNAT